MDNKPEDADTNAISRRQLLQSTGMVGLGAVRTPFEEGGGGIINTQAARDNKMEPSWESTLIATWRGNDPSSTITLQWLTAEDVSVTVELIAESMASHAETDTTVASFGQSEWYRHRAVLPELEPDTRYEIAIEGSNTGLYVRTAPEELTVPLTFVEGGDIGTSSNVSKLHHQASQWNPLFGLVGGDLAYANGENSDAWITFLEHWNEYMRAGDRLIPIVAAIGNHEVQNGFHDSPDEAPFFYTLFDNPSREHAYWALDFGDYLSILLLDSNHSTAVVGAQTEWLAEALADRTHREHLMVAYHVPAYPSVRPIEARNRGDIRKHWVPLFEEHNVDVAFEHDDHTYKRTHLLRDGEPAPDDGILYVGDGAWGQGPRDVKSPEERDYLKISKSTLNVIRMQVSPDGTHQIRAVDSEGKIIDQFDEEGNSIDQTPTPPPEEPSTPSPAEPSTRTEVNTAAESPGFGVFSSIGGIIAIVSSYLLRTESDEA